MRRKVDDRILAGAGADGDGDVRGLCGNLPRGFGVGHGMSGRYKEEVHRPEPEAECDGRHEQR